MLSSVWFTAAVVAVALVCLPSGSEAGQIANGFVMDRIGDVTATATCLTFISGNRALTCSKSGQIDIFKLPKQGQRLVKEVYMKPAYNQLDAKYERGLLDLVPHPNFAKNGLLYMYYCGRDTFHVAEIKHQENQGGSSSRATWFSQKIIWSDPDGIMGKFHYGGSLSFGPDMSIYLTQGDKSMPGRVQDKNTATGCIHRFRTDGTFPEDNMGVLDGKKNRPDSVWATGLRNGWRAHWDIIYGQYYIAEVGGNEQDTATEDIHLGKAGANLGWPMCEGHCSTQKRSHCSCDDYDDPMYVAHHRGKSSAMIGIGVYRGGGFGAFYEGAYFYADFSRGTLMALQLDKTGTKVGKVKKVVHSDLKMTAAGAVGPDGNMYFITQRGGVRRLKYQSKGEMQPVINRVDAEPRAGQAPSQVTFKAGGHDPDGDVVKYRWYFGDGEVAEEQNPRHTYTEPGVYQAILSVTDGSMSAISDPIIISVGQKPEVGIIQPQRGQFFRGGDLIQLEAAASDAGGGVLTEDSVTWTISLIHGTDHFHPFLSEVGFTGSFRVPTDGHAFNEELTFEIEAVVEDSDGLFATETIRMQPELVELTIVTEPAGLTILVDGLAQKAPYTLNL